MHILFLSHYFPPEVNAPATRTYEHCRRWVAAGHQVTVLTCAPNCPNGIVFDGYRNAWRREEEINGIRVLRVWTFLAANKGFAARILNYVSYLILATLHAVTLRNVDVVVATSPQFFCGWAGVLTHWIRRWPFVLEIRDIWPESIVTVGAMNRSPVIRLLEFLERRMYAASDHIVTVGDGYRAKLLERNVPSQKISVVPNGVDLTAFPSRTDSATRHRASQNANFVCTYVGTVGLAHGLDVVLDAAQRCAQTSSNSITFQIVGEGADYQRLCDEASKRCLKNVIFTGLVPKEMIPRVLAESDACLVHLRGTELFGTVIPSKMFEAMAMNVPIIMGVRGPACQIVLDAKAGIAMTPDDAESLLECIDAIASDATRFSQGRDYISQQFDRNELAGEMLDIVQHLWATAHPERSRLQFPEQQHRHDGSRSDKKAA